MTSAMPPQPPEGDLADRVAALWPTLTTEQRLEVAAAIRGLPRLRPRADSRRLNRPEPPELLGGPHG